MLVLMANSELSAQTRVGGGVDRRLSGQQQSVNNRKPMTDKDYLDQSMNKMTSDLNLDSFQAAVIRDLLREEQEKETKLFAEDIPNESKNEQLIVSRDKLNDKIAAILNPEQKIKFEEKIKKKK